jgi:hypothetical protein
MQRSGCYWSCYYLWALVSTERLVVEFLEEVIEIADFPDGYSVSSSLASWNVDGPSGLNPSLGTRRSTLRLY